MPPGAEHLVELTEALSRARNGWMPAVSAGAMRWAVATLADLQQQRDEAEARAQLADQRFDLGLDVLQALQRTLEPHPVTPDGGQPMPYCGAHENQQPCALCNANRARCEARRAAHRAHWAAHTAAVKGELDAIELTCICGVRSIWRTPATPAAVIETLQRFIDEHADCRSADTT